MLHVSRPALASVIAIIIAVTESSILICSLFNYADIGGSPWFAFFRLGLLAAIGLAQDCVHGTGSGGARDRRPPSRSAVLVTSVDTRISRREHCNTGKL
jgi:hypothetical protein